MAYYKHIYNVAPKDIRFSRKGEIIILGQPVGSWSVSYPKKERAAYSLKGRYYAERLYAFGFPYQGSWAAYTKKEMIEKIVTFISQEGIDITSKVAND